jgi:uncharacterized protein (TIGR03084 family)
VLDEILADLRLEGDRLRDVVVPLGTDGWATPTPAAGWTVSTQVAHLLWTDEVAVLAAGARTADGQACWDAVVRGALEDPAGFVDARAHEIARLAPGALLDRWGSARDALAAALRDHPPGKKVPWFGPPMAPTSMATARLMETWAHALDVYAALGIEPERTDRIRAVAHLGVRTRGFAFALHDLPVPPDEPRVELVAPSGATWRWGPEEAAQSVAGSAWDFCLLVTQRVHRADTDLVVTGRDADRWLDIAQAFAGLPGPGRAPRG